MSICHVLLIIISISTTLVTATVKNSNKRSTFEWICAGRLCCWMKCVTDTQTDDAYDRPVSPTALPQTKQTKQPEIPQRLEQSQNQTQNLDSTPQQTWRSYNLNWVDLESSFGDESDTASGLSQQQSTVAASGFTQRQSAVAASGLSQQQSTVDSLAFTQRQSTVAASGLTQRQSTIAASGLIQEPLSGIRKTESLKTYYESLNRRTFLPVSKSSKRKNISLARKLISRTTINPLNPPNKHKDYVEEADVTSLRKKKVSDHCESMVSFLHKDHDQLDLRMMDMQYTYCAQRFWELIDDQYTVSYGNETSVIALDLNTIVYKNKIMNLTNLTSKSTTIQTIHSFNAANQSRCTHTLVKHGGDTFAIHSYSNDFMKFIETVQKRQNEILGIYIYLDSDASLLQQMDTVLARYYDVIALELQYNYLGVLEHKRRFKFSFVTFVKPMKRKVHIMHYLMRVMKKPTSITIMDTLGEHSMSRVKLDGCTRYFAPMAVPSVQATCDIDVRFWADVAQLWTRTKKDMKIPGEHKEMNWIECLWYITPKQLSRYSTAPVSTFSDFPTKMSTI
eukprot:901736_1